MNKMQYKTVLYKNKKYPVISKNNNELLLYSNDKNDSGLEINDFKSINQNTFINVVDVSEIKESEEMVEIDFISIDLLKEEIWFLNKKRRTKTRSCSRT